MANDLVGLLTGISNTQQPMQPMQPIAGTPGFAGMFGAQQAQGLASGLGRIARQGAPSNQERMQEAVSKLDLGSVDGLTTLAKLQQIQGDLTGAAQTATKIKQLRQEKQQQDMLVTEKEQANLRSSSMAQALSKAGYESLAEQVNLGDKEAYKKGLELIAPEKGKTTIEDIVDAKTGITNKVQVDSSGTILRTIGISKMPEIKTITLSNGDIVLENQTTGKRGEPQPTEESANQEKQRIEKLYSDLSAVDSVLLTVAEAKTLAEDPTGSGILYNLASLGVGTSARELAGKVSTLQSTLAFDKLQKMRDESKTGGALGQVSNIELQLLQNALTALDPIIGEAGFKKQLEKVEKHYNNFRKALLGQPIDIDWTQPAYKGKTTVVNGVRYMVDPADSSKVFAIGKE